MTAKSTTRKTTSLLQSHYRLARSATLCEWWTWSRPRHTMTRPRGWTRQRSTRDEGFPGRPGQQLQSRLCVLTRWLAGERVELIQETAIQDYNLIKYVAKHSYTAKTYNKQTAHSALKKTNKKTQQNQKKKRENGERQQTHALTTPNNVLPYGIQVTVRKKKKREREK